MAAQIWQFIAIDRYLIKYMSWLLHKQMFRKIRDHGCLWFSTQTTFELSRHHDFNESGNCELIRMMLCIVPFLQSK